MKSVSDSSSIRKLEIFSFRLIKKDILKFDKKTWNHLSFRLIKKDITWKFIQTYKKRYSQVR